MGAGAAYQAAVGQLLGALVAADAPALRELDVANGFLGETVLGPLCAALPHNTHLLTLDCSGNETMDVAFARDVLLPAVRANTSLRTLFARNDDDDVNILVREAERVIAERADADDAAAQA
jgi:hypothetical protein